MVIGLRYDCSTPKGAARPRRVMWLLRHGWSSPSRWPAERRSSFEAAARSGTAMFPLAEGTQLWTALCHIATVSACNASAVSSWRWKDRDGTIGVCDSPAWPSWVRDPMKRPNSLPIRAVASATPCPPVTIGCASWMVARPSSRYQPSLDYGAARTALRARHEGRNTRPELIPMRTVLTSAEAVAQTPGHWIGSQRRLRGDLV